MNDATIMDQLRTNAAELPDRLAIGWFDSEAREKERLTVGELDLHSRRLAGALLAEGCRPGEVVLLIYPPGLEFFKAFLACLHAGLIPAPVYPPNPLEGERLGFLSEVCRRLDIRVALTTTTYTYSRRLGNVRNVLRRRRRWPKLKWLATDKLRLATPPEPRYPRPSDVALIQFTSGSTSAPRGVQLTFANLAHQLSINQEHVCMSRESSGVVWLPQYHDFGLINAFMNAVCVPFPVWFCSPLDFIRRPACWPEMMHKTRATHTASPSFGYALLLRRTTAQQRASWDLSHLVCSMCAAEVIRPEVIRGFIDAFAVSGLRPEAMASAYGLAEHTVAATNGAATIRDFDRQAMLESGVLLPVSPEAPSAVAMVSSGAALEGVELRIVDPERGQELPDGHIGEVWLQSPSVSPGYANDAEKTARQFQARLAGEAGMWLRSGDLGALVDGLFFCTGRLKELIIVRGRNVYPADVEAAARAAHPAIRPGGVAAVPLQADGAERLAVIVELRDAEASAAERRAIRDAVHSAVTEHGYSLHTLCLVRRATLPKSTSGKLRRSTLAQRVAAGWAGESDALLDSFTWGDPASLAPEELVERLELALARATSDPPAQRPLAIRAALDSVIAELVGASSTLTVPANVTLMELGLDSLGIAHLMEILQRATGVEPERVVLAELVHVDRLADWLLEATRKGGPERALSEVDEAPEVVAATPFQHLLWRDHGASPAYFAVFEVEGSLTDQHIESASERLVARHDVLQAGFEEVGGELLLRRSATTLASHVIAHDPESCSEEALVEAMREAIFRPFELDRSPLMRIARARTSATRTVIAIAAHHLIYDAVAIQTLVQEWIALLDPDADDEPSQEDDESCQAGSFFQTAKVLAQRPVDDDLIRWWRGYLDGAAWPMPVASDRAPTEIWMEQCGELVLGVAETSALTAFAQRQSATLNSVACLGWAAAMCAQLEVDELITGCAVSTRSLRERSLVGPLVDDVLLRICLEDADAPVGDVLRRIAGDARDTAARVDLSFARILEVVEEVGEIRPSPVSACPVLYNFYDWDGLMTSPSARILRAGGWLVMGALRVRMRPDERRNPARPYDYFALAQLEGGELHATLRVQRDRVGVEIGRAIVERWRRALELLAADPGVTIGALRARTCEGGGRC